MFDVIIGENSYKVYELIDYKEFIYKLKCKLVDNWKYTYKLEEQDISDISYACDKEGNIERIVCESIIQKRHRIYIANIPCSFDIETSSFYNYYDEKTGKMTFYTNKEMRDMVECRRQKVYREYKALLEDLKTKHGKAVKYKNKKYIDVTYKKDGVNISKFIKDINDIEEEAETEAKAASVEYANRFQQRACMYCWQMCFCDDLLIMGRNWESWFRLLEMLRYDLNLGYDKKLVCYIHNASYEFQFFKGYFTWNEEPYGCLFNNKIVYYANVEGIYRGDDDFATGVRTDSLDGFLFKDSLVLAGVKEEKLPSIMKNNSIEKLVGSLDYEKVRHGGNWKRGILPTPLNNEELAYCINDVRLLNAYIKQKMDEYGSIVEIPMTKTDETRIRTRNGVLYSNPKGNHGRDKKFLKYRKFLDEMKIDLPQYQMIKRAYAGGFTHANYKHACEIIEDKVKSIDLASSYPSVMVCKKFPMSAYREVSVKDYDELAFYLKNYACLFNIRFIGLRPKYNEKRNIDMGCVDSIISISKVEEYSKMSGYKDPTDKTKGYNRMPEYIKGHKTIKEIKEDVNDSRINNNGRLREAQSIYLTINEIDFDNICSFYIFDDVQIGCFYIAEKDYLPKDLIEQVLALFRKKTEYKPHDGEDSPEGLAYDLSKVDINSLYGILSTDLLRDEYKMEKDKITGELKIVSRGQDEENADKMFEEMAERLDKKLDSKRSFTCYQWSHCLCSHARANIFQALIAAGYNYCYSDTDSCYYIDFDAMDDFIESYNKNIDKEMNECFEHYGLPKDSHKASYVNKKGQTIEKCLGYFEKQNDGKPYKRFVAAHAKCYLKETYEPDKNGETLHLTVAGLSKKTVHYLEEKYGRDELFERFAKGDIYVDRENTSKLMATYIDFSTKGPVVDYLGNKSTFAEMSSVHLEKADFDMHLTGTYKDLIEEGRLIDLEEDRVYEGL